MEKIFIYNRPAPRTLLWSSISIVLGCLFLFIVYSFVRQTMERPERISDQFSSDFFVLVIMSLFFLSLSLFLLWFGFKRSIRIERIIVNQEFISLSGGLFLSSGKRFYAGGLLKIPISSDFRFRAVKDGFLKSVGFYLDLPVESGSHSYLIVEHCVDPLRLAQRINSVLEKNGCAPREVHMSRALEKSLYEKNVKNQNAQTTKKARKKNPHNR
ncbi:hypothetical protein [Leptospira adleri]|uniref:Uncharacterized protein n=1 Tax=Leptospira adleri TaxID=2023186 RepID=A0A2M9YNZ8_9LEPT|nr:hypothetical protein [Leptospira adleri]PJZ53258.1 hypothetical protein CH380_10650 [Leptospira adleri]PJZ63934.1 hypothetical protein CH376_00460 [Leptospira adleri]